MALSGPSWPSVAGAVTGIQVGAAMVASRFVIEETTPGALAFLRYALAVSCLLPVAIAAGGVRFERRDLPPVIGLGILQFGVLIALLNFGLRFVPSARAALIFATFPLITLIFAASFGHERLTVTKTVAVALTVVGVAAVLGEGALEPNRAAQSWVGEFAVLGSAVLGALCSVLYRPYLRKYSALPLGTLAMLGSVAFLAVLAAYEGFFAGAPAFTHDGWLAVVFIGLSSGIGYFLWLWALRHSSATNVTVFLALSPVTAAALGGLLLGERITVMLGIGIALIVFGIWLAHRPASRPESLD